MRKEAGALLAAGLAIAGTLITRPDQYVMDSEDYRFRDQILSSYPFTVEAVRYLREVPFFNRHTTTNGGGGWHTSAFPFPNYITVNSNQAEAALHEMSHSFFDYMRQQDQTFGDRFMASAVKVALEDDPYGYYRHLLFGFPGQQRGPIAMANYSETYASIASKNMGENFPEPLKDYYKYEFQIEK